MPGAGGAHAPLAGVARPILVLCNDTDYFLRHRTPLVEALVGQGRRVVVVTGGRAPAQAEIRGWEHVLLPIERWAFSPRGDARLLWRTLTLIATLRPAALHLITLKPAVFGGLAALVARGAKLGPSRIVVTIPGLGRLMAPGRERAAFRARASRRLVDRAIRLLSRSGSVHFTFETRHDRDLWVREGRVAAARAHVIGGAGVDAARFHPAPGPRPERPLTVLFASRLLRAKGLDAFVAAARKLGGRPDCRFAVAGMVEPDEPDRFPIAELTSLPNLDFLGESRDMPRLLRSVDLVCLPTRYGEGIPRILIEAAATGVPCIATDLDGCREVVEHGTNGFLLSAAPVERMAEEICGFIERYLTEPDLLARHAEGGLALFRARPFQESAVVRAFLELVVPQGDQG